MKKLFTIGKIDFYENEFLDNIEEYRDIIDIIEDFQENMTIEKINCVDKNDCCNKTTENYISELIGVLTTEDEFYTLEEVRSRKKDFENQRLDPFGIQVYKCTQCNKWIINILE